MNATIEKENYDLQRKEHVNLATVAYERAKSIRDQSTFDDATSLLLQVKDRRNKWVAFFDPIVREAKRMHNQALSKRREVEEPLRQAEEDILKPAIGKWVSKQEEIRKAQEKQVEKDTGFDVVLPQTTKQEGISYRTTWNAVVTDKLAFVKAVAEGRVPLEAVTPNQPLLNNMAKNFKTGLGWPGVEVKSEKTISARPQNMEIF